MNALAADEGHLGDIVEEEMAGTTRVRERERKGEGERGGEDE